MNIFGKRNGQAFGPSVDEAERQLTALQEARQRTQAEYAAQQRARDEAIATIGDLKSKAAISDGEERAELLNRIEELTREKLMLAQAEISTTESALKILSQHVTDAEQVLTLATLGGDRDRLDAMIDKYHAVAGLLEEDLQRVLEHVQAMGHLTSRIEPGIDHLRASGRQWGVETPRFERTPVVSVLNQRILKAWNSGVESHESREAVERPRVDQAAALPVSPGETIVADGHAWTFTMLESGAEAKCTRDDHCSDLSVARLIYTPPSAPERSWLGCQRHLEDFRHKYFRAQVVSR